MTASLTELSAVRRVNRRKLIEVRPHARQAGRFVVIAAGAGWPAPDVWICASRCQALRKATKRCWQNADATIVETDPEVLL